LNDSSVVGAADGGLVSRSELSRMLFVVGHVALKLLVHTEGMVSKLRRVQQGIKAPAAAGGTAKPVAGMYPAHSCPCLYADTHIIMRTHAPLSMFTASTPAADVYVQPTYVSRMHT
jgi:hypothetical protein